MTTVKADVAAADRVLKAAVRKARQEIANGGTIDVYALTSGKPMWSWRTYNRDAVTDMLTAATRTADLLLEES